MAFMLESEGESVEAESSLLTEAFNTDSFSRSAQFSSNALIICGVSKASVSPYKYKIRSSGVKSGISKVNYYS